MVSFEFCKQEFKFLGKAKERKWQHNSSANRKSIIVQEAKMVNDTKLTTTDKTHLLFLVKFTDITIRITSTQFYPKEGVPMIFIQA